MSKPNRTKGNAKASSSGKAAELLQNSTGSLLPSQIGFGLNEDEEFTDLDPSYRTIFRKLSKKDSLTRIKGLQDLYSFLENDELKIILVALDCWPRFYSKLSLDGNFKIRSWSHKVMFKFAEKVGKGLSKHLKAVIPFWYFGRSDAYLEVSKVASEGLSSIFPAQKSVLVVSKFAIQISELCCNILESNGVYLIIPSDKKDESEDITSRKFRLWTCALESLAALTQEINIETVPTLIDSLIIIQNTNFWKNLAKNDSISVNQSLLKLTRNLVIFGGSRMEEYGKNFMPPICGFIDQNQPTLSNCLWECLLTIMDKYKEKTWTFCSLNKMFIPKLLSCLRDGARGGGVFVGPACLPILTIVPIDEQRYCQRIVNACFEGSLRNISSNGKEVSEKLSLIYAASECICYGIKKTEKMSELEWTFVEVMVFLNKLLPEVCNNALWVGPSSLILEFCFALENKSENSAEYFEKLKSQHFELINKMISMEFNRMNLQDFGALYLAPFIGPKSSNLTLEMAGNVVEKCIDGLKECKNPEKYLALLIGILEKSEFGNWDKFGGIKPNLTLKNLVNILIARAFEKEMNEHFELIIKTALRAWALEKEDHWKLDLLSKIAESCLLENTICKTTTVLISLHALVQVDKSALEFLQSEEFSGLWLRYISSALMSQDPNVKHALKSILTCSVNGLLCLPQKLLDCTLCCVLEILEKNTQSCNVSVLDSCIEVVCDTALVLLNNSHTCEKASKQLILEAFSLNLNSKSNGISEKTLASIKKLWSNGLQLFLERGTNFYMEKITSQLINMSKQKLHAVEDIEGYNLIFSLVCEIFEVVKGMVTDTSDETKDRKLSPKTLLDIIHYSLMPNSETWTELENFLGNEWQFIHSLGKKELFHELPVEIKRTTDFSFITTAVFCGQILTEGCVFVKECENVNQLRYSYVIQRFYQAAAVLQYFCAFETGSSKTLLVSLKGKCNKIADYLNQFSEEFFAGQFNVCDPNAEFSFLEAVGIEYMMNNIERPECKPSSWPPNLEEEEETLDGKLLKTVNQAILLKDDDVMKSVHSKIGKECLKMKMRILTAGVYDINYIMQFVLEEKDNFEKESLLCCNIQNTSMDKLHFNVCLINVLIKLVEEGVLLNNNDLKDYVFCVLVGSLQSCAESFKSCIEWCPFYVYLVHCLSLFRCCNKSVTQNSEQDSSLTQEWNEFFLDGCSSAIIPLFFQISTSYLEDKLLLAHRTISLTSLAPLLNGLKAEHILSRGLPTLLDPQLDEKQYPRELQEVLLNICPLLESNEIATQLGAFYIISKVLPLAAEIELVSGTCSGSTLEGEGDREGAGEEERKPPGYLLDSLNRCYTKISEHIMQQNLELSTESDLFAPLHGYLLCWNLLNAGFYSKIAADQRPSHCLYLKKSNLLENLILSLFCVLPEKLDKLLEGNTEENYQYLFDNDPYQSDCVVVDVLQLERGCLYLYCLTLQLFPAAVRTWFRAQSKNLAGHVEKFTSAFISPYLCNKELKSAAAYPNLKTDNMTVSTRPNAREVVATYKMEDMSMELLVSIPINYPLQQPNVSAAKRVGVTVEKWRKWMLQLTAFLQNQNGSLLDGLLLWKRSVDQHLDGIEDCPICFMAVHSSNYQLPRVTCRQCKKKFHASCLYKWFNSSHNTSCPLCRTNF